MRVATRAAILIGLLFASSAWAAPSQIAVAVDGGADGRSSRIYVALADGSGLRAVSAGLGRDRAPAFSPDGKWLAYQSTSELGLDTVLVQPLDGSRPARRVSLGAAPQWSRDGQRLLFSRRQLNEWKLYVAKADGSEPEDTLKPLARGMIGRWSPEEKQLAAVVPVIAAGQDRWQIQLSPAERPEPRVRLTLPESFGQVVSLEWSPDGGRLLFSTTRGTRYELYVIDLRSPEPRRVPVGEGAPNAAFGAWSPDGKEILFRTAVGDEETVPLSRLCVMNADGTGVRTLWEPGQRPVRLYGTAWHHPLVVTAAVPPALVPPPLVPAPVRPPEPAVKQPAPAGCPLGVVPAPAPALGAPVRVHGSKVFTVPQPRSPVSVRLAVPGARDFSVAVAVQPQAKWKARRQGVGITLDLEDGSLYRGTVIHSGGPWVTLQGRPRGGKVRLIDGKKLAADGPGFEKGFTLTVRREGRNLVLTVDGEDVLTRPVLEAGVRQIQLTLENFDPGKATFPLTGAQYRVAEAAAAQP